MACIVVGMPCDCAGCTTTICVVWCSTVPVYGAGVAILSGSTVVASGTTGSGGCVTLTIPAAGSYTVQVTVSGSVVYSATKSLACNGTTTIGLTTAPVVCCGGYAIPDSLTLTDAAGSLGFVYLSGSSPPSWYGGHAVTQTSCPVTTPGGICVVGAPSSGPVRCCYQMTCHAGSNPTFGLQRAWSWVYESGTLTPIWYQDPGGFPAGICTTAPPASCGSPLTDTASDAENPTSTLPFMISFSPSPAGGNATGDPVGGSVSISQ